MDDVDDGWCWRCCHWWFDSFFFRFCCWCWLLNTLVILSYITGVYPLEKQRNEKQKTNIQTTSSSSIAHTFRILKKWDGIIKKWCETINFSFFLLLEPLFLKPTIKHDITLSMMMMMMYCRYIFLFHDRHGAERSKMKQKEKRPFYIRSSAESTTLWANYIQIFSLSSSLMMMIFLLWLFFVLFRIFELPKTTTNK